MTASAAFLHDPPVRLLCDEIDEDPAAPVEPAGESPHDTALKMYISCCGVLDGLSEQDMNFISIHLPKKERIAIQDRWEQEKKAIDDENLPKRSKPLTVIEKGADKAPMTVPASDPGTADPPGTRENVPQFVRDYEEKHPEYFPSGTSLETKIEVLKKIENIRSDEKRAKVESFRKLDAATEAKAIEIDAAKKEREIAETARAIYESGDFLKYCTDTFGKVWYGDVHILTGILLMAANLRVLNAKDGLHLHVNGQTQSGKSDSVKAALRFVHPNDQSTKTFSQMYLFHASKTGDLHEGMLIFSDDTMLSEDVAQLYRNVLTSWYTGVDRGTVVNHEPKTLHIPARVSLILTSVESVVQETDEGQDESRFLTLEVKRTADQMKVIREFIQQDHPDIKQDLEVIHAVWIAITPRDVKIHRAIERNVPIRELKRFLTMVQSHALLCNRTETTEADFSAIDMFLSYSKPMIDSETPAFKRKEAVVLQCLSSKPMTVSEIVDATGISILEVYRALRGTTGSFSTPSGGLMQKERRLIHNEERSATQNNLHTFKLKAV